MQIAVLARATTTLLPSSIGIKVQEAEIFIPWRWVISAVWGESGPEAWLIRKLFKRLVDESNDRRAGVYVG